MLDGHTIFIPRPDFPRSLLMPSNPTSGNGGWHNNRGRDCPLTWNVR